MRVCFIGLGTMGLPMALRLEEQQFELSGWDVNANAGASLQHQVSTLEEAAAGADVLITMLPEGEHVEATYRDLQALELPEDRLFMDCSTIDVETTKQLAKSTLDAGHGFVDAPVSGGHEGARAGTLSFMIGGDTHSIERAKPVLQAMGSKVTEFGDAGAGQAAKACHNMICGITALGVCEAFALADSLGLDADSFFNLCKGAAAQSWILENRCPVPGPAPASPASNDYAPGFAARLMAKDLRLAQAAAGATGQETPFGSEAARRFTEFAEGGGGDLDFSAIYPTIRNP
jgi:3-hydroxyisobutyrate dehydrogenase